MLQLSKHDQIFLLVGLSQIVKSNPNILTLFYTALNVTSKTEYTAKRASTNTCGNTSPSSTYDPSSSSAIELKTSFDSGTTSLSSTEPSSLAVLIKGLSTSVRYQCKVPV